MSEKQQTAVEWLVEQITNGTIQAREAIQQARAMEKEQMIEFFMKGQNTYPSEYVLDNQQIAEQYYNETFKSENIVMFMTPENGEIESIILTDNPDCGVKGITFKSE